MIRWIPFLALLAVLLGTLPVSAVLSVDVETGLVFSGYNDVRIPGDTGTLFSLSEDLDVDPTSFFRVRVHYTLARRHTLSLLAAPLRLEAGGAVDRAVIFQDEEFAPLTELKARYRFDSYRLTYRYNLRTGHPLEAGLGLTAKIRDASIRVEGDGRRSEKKNTGFVPLVNFRLRWMMTDQLGFLLEGDALAAPQGRAEDVLLGLYFRPGERVGMKAGYRILEGGADNDEVYNLSLIHI